MSKKKDVVESSIGAWGYDVDSVEFVRELRRSDKCRGDKIHGRD
ncbi:MAG: hypothetical protein ACOC5D_06050 [Thermoplasmatota archaeon]